MAIGIKKPGQYANHVLPVIKEFEANVERKLQERTTRIRPAGFLTLAIASMGVSAALALFAKRRTLSNFVGLWAPSLLLLGVYSKLSREHSETKTEEQGKLREGPGPEKAPRTRDTMGYGY